MNSVHMPLREKIQSQGNWLFRRRSMMPFTMIPLLVLAFRQYHYPNGCPGSDIVWEAVCLLVSSVGLAMRFYISGTKPKRTSGRNTRKGQVADALNTSGLYSIVRHPLYVANFLVALGPVMFFHLWWLPMVFTVIFWLYYERIMFAEEEFLREKFGNDFIEWSRITPAIIPSLRSWRKPALSFSLRTALKQEYQTIFQVVAIFASFEFIGDAMLLHRFAIDRVWSSVFCVFLGIYLIMRLLRKTTRVLHVPGR